MWTHRKDMELSMMIAGSTTVEKSRTHKPRGFAIALLVLAFGFSTINVPAQTLSWPAANKSWVIYPEYLSKTEIVGTQEVVIVNLQLSVDVGSLDITGVELTPLNPLTDNTFDADAELGVLAVHGYITGKTILFTPGMAGEMTSSDYTVSEAGATGVITVTFTGGYTLAAGNYRLHISFNIPAGVTSSNLAYRITSITHSGLASPLTGPPTPTNDPFTSIKIRNFN